MQLLILIVSLAVLVFSAELLIKGSVAIAYRLKVSKLIVGLTIIAFGTSLPELVVSVTAAINNSPDISVGNIVGSNIANILLILGVAAMFTALKVRTVTVRNELPVALLGAVILLVMAADKFISGAGMNEITRSEGLILLSCFLGFVYYIFRQIRSESNQTGENEPEISMSKAGFYCIGGLVLLLLSGRFLVTSASSLAAMAGLSEVVIGLTIVAVGTSLPEFVSSIVAVRHGHTDIAIGNVVGSNIINTFFILGVASTIHPITVHPEVVGDIIIMSAVTFLLFAVMFIGSKHRLSRNEGVVFLLMYTLFIGYLVYRV